MRKTLLIALSSFFVICSCSKSGSSATCEKTVAGIAGTYKITLAETSIAGTYVDVTSLIPACKLDDNFQLKSDKSVIYTDAGTSCAPSGSTTGTWDVAGTTISLNIPGFPLPVTSATIVSYNCTTLVATFNSSGTDYRITITKV